MPADLSPSLSVPPVSSLAMTLRPGCRSALVQLRAFANWEGHKLLAWADQGS